MCNGAVSRFFHLFVAAAFLATLAIVPAAIAQSGTIGFSSVSHNFGTVAYGQTASYGTFLTNNTGADFPFAVTLSNTNGFAYQTNCAATVAAGAKCEILFTFTSSNNGNVSSAWSLANPNGVLFSPSNGGTLTADGTANAGFTLSVPAHNFGSQWINTNSSVFGAVLSNSTVDPIALSVTASFGTGSNFPLAINNCGAVLAADSTCNLQWTFNPTAAINYNASYTVTGVDTVTGVQVILTSNGSQVLGIQFAGTGIDSGALTLSSSNYNFGEQGVNTTSQLFGAQLTNETANPVTLAFSGSSPHFALVANNCPATLAPLTSCNLQFSYKPQATGSQQLSYQISASSNGQPVQIYTNSGAAATGITLQGSAINGVLQLKTNGHNFGPWVVGTTSNKYLTTLTNTTNVTMGLGMGYGLNSSFEQLSLVGTTCGTTLIAGASCAIEWEFSPNMAGPFGALYQISASDSTNGQAFAVTTGGTAERGVTLSGNGQATTGLTLASATENFGEQGVGGGSAVRGTVLYNTTGSPVSLSFGYADAATANNFRMITNNCPATMPTNTSCNLQWEFTPIAAGSLTAVYQVNATIAQCATKVTYDGEGVSGITLNGEGVN